ncbi:MAG: sulfonate/nitrate/taurine transporter substrate-binding protein [Hyphomicrobiales bacterium]|nr:sulfonate/nitrate/taurine transporter substrate-binding protein [Hyphomicrobiales bacterium]
MFRFTPTALALAAGLALALPAQAETSAKFVLDWTVIGTHAPFSVALEKKLFEKEGLKISIDRGYGSVDTIGKVANGVYEFGFADPNLLLKYNKENPNAKVTMVLLVYDGGQSAIVARRTSGITGPGDLAGKKIGAPPGDNSRQMFPVYAKAAGIDASKIEWVSANPAVKETLLLKGDLDAVATLEPTTLLGLKKLGAKPDDYVSLRYGKYLPELLGTGILVSQKTIKEKPEMVRAFVKAIIAGEKIALADPEASIKTLTLLDPMADVGNELTRFKLGVDMSMADPSLKTNGIGTVAPARLAKALGYISETFEVPLPADHLGDLRPELPAACG